MMYVVNDITCVTGRCLSIGGGRGKINFSFQLIVHSEGEKEILCLLVVQIAETLSLPSERDLTLRLNYSFLMLRLYVIPDIYTTSAKQDSNG